VGRTVSAAPGPCVQIVRVADCPSVERVRQTVSLSLARAGCEVSVEELEGDYPSPTVLVDGVDVVTGEPPARHCACRLDLPTEAQVVAALRAAQLRRVPTSGGTTDVG
jgi:hypothetical protein